MTHLITEANRLRLSSTSSWLQLYSRVLATNESNWMALSDKMKNFVKDELKMRLHLFPHHHHPYPLHRFNPNPGPATTTATTSEPEYVSTILECLTFASRSSLESITGDSSSSSSGGRSSSSSSGSSSERGVYGKVAVLSFSNLARVQFFTADRTFYGLFQNE